ncbi:MAG: hypothetical protein ACOYMA_14185, partial [Bacteroidia bacterium]
LIFCCPLFGVLAKRHQQHYCLLISQINADVSAPCKDASCLSMTIPAHCLNYDLLLPLFGVLAKRHQQHIG